MTFQEFTSLYQYAALQAGVSGAVLRRYQMFSEEVYGEALPILVDSIITALKMSPNKTFYDLGSGLGNVCLQFSCCTGCKSIGVEIRKELHEYAIHMAETMKTVLSKTHKKMGEVQFHNVCCSHYA